MNNFLKNRKSVRDFKKKKLDKKTFERIMESCKQFEEEGNNSFEFLLFQDGDRVYNTFKGIGGYAGVMIESPHYIGLKINNDEEKAILYGSYYAEKLITQLTNLNVGSCWISVNDVDSNVRGDLLGIENGTIDYLLAIGYPVAKNPFVEEPFSSRFGVEDIVFKDEIGKPISVDELESRGLDDLFYYIRFAPSSHNRQPWRFVLKDNRVILLIAYSDEEKLSLADAGIIMYYFENLARSIGIDNKWDLIDGVNYEGDKYKYRYIGEFGL